MNLRLLTWGLAGLFFGQGIFPAVCLATPTVGAPVVSVATIPVGEATELIVTSRITSAPTDPPVIATGVNLLRVNASNKAIAILGTMRDDGTGGDAVAGDRTFTLRLTRTEPNPGELRLRVSAAFKGLVRRVFSAGVTIVPIVVAETDDDRDGFTESQGDCNDTDPAVHPGAAERCNRVDDNCDGRVDEAFDLGAACTAGVGACQRSGTQVCSPDGATTVCDAVAGDASPEVCNGIDDDCNGEVDDGLGPVTCGVGACSRSVAACVGGQPQPCIPGNPGTEVCGNGIDEDCDGADLPCAVATRGVIAGEVYDDTTGLAVAQASVELVSVDDGPPAPPVPNVGSDARGRFRIGMDRGLARIRVSKPGFTAADRVVQVVEGKRTAPFDARLTPLDANQTSISSVLGGTVANLAGDLQLSIPAGALSADQQVHLTRIGPQGLIGLLPLGWSPVAAVDIIPASISFALAASLSIPAPAGLADAAQLVVARWDDDGGSWIVEGNPSRVAGGGLQFGLTRTGQYALLLADPPPHDPPPAIPGEVLRGTFVPLPPQNVMAIITPSPKILLAEPGIHSQVDILTIAAAPMPSGMPLQASLDEAFNFVGGTHLFPDPATQDLSLYAFPPTAGGQSEFTVTASPAIDPLALQLGVIDVTARMPIDPRAPKGAVFGVDGGVAAASTGEQVVIPPGAAGADLPVLLSGLSQEDFPAAIPDGLTFLGAVTFDLHGALINQPATLSIPAPAGLPPSAQILVVQLVEVGGVSHLALVALAKILGADLVALTDPRGDGSLRLPGIQGEGRYAFLRADAPLGFITGMVFGDTGLPRPGALVSLDTLEIVALTDADGRYVLAAPIGAVHVTATDPVTKDIATRTGTLSAPDVILSLDLSLASTPPSVVEVTPANSAQDVPFAAVVKVVFSEPVDGNSVTQSSGLTNASGPVSGTVSLTPDRQTLTFRPDTFLQSQTTYTFTLDPSIRDLTGNRIGSAFMSQFSTIDLTPPPRPAAGQISATIPDATGRTTVSGTQGTAEPGGAVVVKNLKTGALTTFTPNSDGSFSGTVQASPADRLELIIRDAAGNETSISLGAFRNADGRVVVGSEGGRVDGPGGVFVDIPSGALPDGTVVKIDPITAADLPLPAPADFPFVGGVRLDLGGATALQPLDIGIPPPPDAQPTDQVLVARAIQVRGQPAWTVVDRALEEVLGDGIGNEDGTCDAATEVCVNRYRTGSDPFPQVFGGGDYAFFRAESDCISWVHMRLDFVFDFLIDASGIGFVFPTLHVSMAVMPAVCGAPVDIRIVDPDTDEVIRRIARRAPDRRDEIDEPTDIDSDDRTPPIIIETNLFSGYQISEIEIRFSEPMDAMSIDMGVSVFDSGGSRVGGHVELSEGDSLAVFAPDLPFNLGEQHRVKLSMVADRAMNVMPDVELTFTPFDPTRTDPFPLQSLRNVPGLTEVLEKCVVGACTHSTRDVALLGNTLFVANGLTTAAEHYTISDPPQKLIAINVDDATDPVRIGFNATHTNPRVLAAVDNVDFPAFAGDLLIVAGGGRAETERPPVLEFYNVTPCTQRPVTISNCLDDSLPTLRASKLLGVTGSGTPQQLAVLHQRVPGDDTVIAYVVTSTIGLQGVDVRRAFDPRDDTPVGLARGDFLDVAVLDGLFERLVLAVELVAATSEFQLDVFSPQLTDKRPVALPGPASRVVAAPNYVVDVDGDGRVLEAERDDEDETTLEDELFDLALVTSGPLFEGCADTVPCGKLYVVDLSAISGLGHVDDRGVIAEIPLPGPAFSLQYDPQARLAYVEVRGQGLAIVDLGNIEEVIRGTRPGLALVDSDSDGRDDRVLAIVPKSDIFAGEIKLDMSRGLGFVNGAVNGTDILQIANACNELSADFEPQETEPDPVAERTRRQDDEKKLIEEKDKLVGILNRAAQTLIAAGFQEDSDGDGMPDRRSFSMLEQGSGACFWREPFPTTCTSFQAGTSDHDIEVFLPQQDVQRAQETLDTFIDAEEEAGRLKDIGRVTLFAFSRGAFEAAELLNGTPRNRSGDPAGDLAMGRQLLLLLWLLEGEYVTGFEGALSLDDILAELKAFEGGPLNPVIPGEPSGIPRLEGYEWAVLQELNFYKTGALLRIAGACETANRAFGPPPEASTDLKRGDASLNFEEADFLQKDCQEQLHTVAKSAIRSVMARLAANDDTNPTILDIDDRASYRTKACLTGVGDVRDPRPDPGAYTPKPCGSFEEYIASVAIKSVRDNLGVFHAEDLPRIFRFYCVKVGKNCANRDGKLIGGPYLRTDAEANEFIADALDFIEDTQEHDHTLDIYNDTVALDRLKPIGEIPFLTEIRDECAKHGVSGVNASSLRLTLRACNRAIVAAKLDGEPMALEGLGPPRPVEVGANKDRRKKLAKGFGAKRLVQRNLQVRAVNEGARRVDEAVVRVYEGDGVHQPIYMAEKTVPVDLFPGQRRVIEVDEQKEPIFPTSFDLSQFTGNVPGAISFFFDPERRVPEGDKKDNAAAFFYYLLDRNTPEGPPDLAPQPELPIKEVDPDPLCVPPPAMVLEATARTPDDDAPLPSNEITVQVGQEIVLDYRVRNRRGDKLTMVVVRRDGENVLNADELPGREALPEGVRVTERFTPPGPNTYFIVLSVLARDERGNTVTSNTVRIKVTVPRPPCDALITALSPDPNPVDQKGLPFSEVQQGGSLFRYYRVIDGKTGQPLPNAGGSFRLQHLPGGTIDRHDFSTDSKGFIRHEPIDSDDDGRGLRITLGPPSDDPFEIQVDSVNDFNMDKVCAQTFRAAVKKRTFTRTLAGGSSLNVEGKLGIFAVGGVKGVGMSLEEESDTESPKTLKVKRTFNSNPQVAIKRQLFKEKARLLGEVSLVKAGGQLALTQLLMLQDAHEFTSPPSTSECNAIIALVSGASFSGAVSLIPFAGPFATVAVTEIQEHFLPFDVDEHRTSFGGSLGLDVAFGIKFEGPTFSFRQSDVPALDQFAVGFDFDGSAKAAAIAGLDVSRNREDVENGDTAFKQLSASLTYKAAVNISGGLDVGLSHLEDEAFERGEETVKEKVTKTTSLLKTKFNQGVVGNMTFAADFDLSQPVPKVVKLRISLGQPKTWGFDADLGPIASLSVPGATSSFKFAITDDSKFPKAIKKIALIQALTLAQIPVLGPTLLGEQIVGLLRLADESSDELERGIGIEIPLNLDKFLENSPAKGGLKLKLDSSVSHDTRKSAVRSGEIFQLERHADDDSLVPSVLDLALPGRLLDCFPFAKTAIRGAYKAQSVLIRLGMGVSRTLIEQFFSPSGVQLSIDGAAEPDPTQPFTLDLLAFQYRPVAGPLQPTIQDPAGISGPADQPHYGIGGFFRFAPEEESRSLQLTAPAQLTIRWLDEEVASFDETSLAIYAWSDQRQDWDLVGGTVDPADNSITADVNQLGLYTVAPPMPAGGITLTAQSSSPGADLSNPTTIVSYVSDPVRMNTGALVPDGTAFTVRTLLTGTSALVPFGVVTSVDEDSSTDGIQVRSLGGVIHFTTEFPGKVGAALVVVNSVQGTALAAEEMAYP